MNQQKIRGLLLALIYMLGLMNNWAAAQPVDPIWREVNKVTFGSLNRRPPSTPLPPIPAGTVAAWRAEMAGAVRAAPTSTVWEAVKGNGVLRGNIPKGLGQFARGNVLFTVGVVGINAALTAFYNQVRTDANPSNSELGLCLSNSRAFYPEGNANALSVNAVCESSTSSTAINFPPGSFPPKHVTGPNPPVSTWWDFTLTTPPESAGRYYFRVSGTPYEGNYHVEVYCSAPYGEKGQALNRSQAQVMAAYEYHVQNCKPQPQTSTTGVSLQEFVDGTTINGRVIPPHPGIKEEIKGAIVSHIERGSPTPSAGGQVYPGMTLDPPPSASEWFGVPINTADDDDGDTWSSWEEILRGSDPADPLSRPDPNRDTDGDSVKDGDEDKYGSDPYDPASKPSPAIIGDIDGDGIPNIDDPDKDGDGVLNEVDPQPENKSVPVKCGPGFMPTPDGMFCVLDPVQTPKDEAACTGQGGTWTNGACVLPERQPGMPKIDGLDPNAFKLPNFAPVKTNFDVNLGKLKLAVSDKFPFGIGKKWFPSATTVGSECPSYPFTVRYLVMTLKPCEFQVAQDAHSIMRPFLVGILWICIGIWAARIAGEA